MGVAESVEVQVATPQGPIDTFTMTADEFAPGFFMFNPQDRKYVAAVHLDGFFVGPGDLFGGAVPTRPRLLEIRFRFSLPGSGKRRAASLKVKSSCSTCNATAWRTRSFSRLATPKLFHRLPVWWVRVSISSTCRSRLSQLETTASAPASVAFPLSPELFWLWLTINDGASS